MSLPAATRDMKTTLFGSDTLSRRSVALAMTFTVLLQQQLTASAMHGAHQLAAIGLIEALAAVTKTHQSISQHTVHDHDRHDPHANPSPQFRLQTAPITPGLPLVADNRLCRADKLDLSGLLVAFRPPLRRHHRCLCDRKLGAIEGPNQGTVVDVRVDNTQHVRQGDVLITLDGLQAKVALEQAMVNLADSVRQVDALFSQADLLRQKLLAKEAVLQRSRSDLSRYRSVAADGAVSAQQIEDSEFQVRELEAEVRQIRAELAEAYALVQNTSPENNPKVLQAAAALKQAYLDNVHQQIVAPVSGYVAKRGIQPGDQDKPETPLLAIVPLDYLWIEANFLEDELTDVRPGQPVEVTVDLYASNIVYHGETEVYDRQLDGADELIKKIIEQNRVSQ